MSASLTKADIAYMKAHASDNVQPNYIAACACGLGLAYISVILRFASRRIVHAPLKTDDWLLLIGLVMVTGYIVANAFSVHYGMGRHIIFVTNAKGLVQANLAAEIIYSFSFIPIKWSILFFYCRLFNSHTLNKVCIGIGTFVATCAITQGFGMIFQCVPISANWNGGGRCINTAVFFTLMASFNVITDVAILIIPMPFIYSLSLPQSGRFQLVIIFTLGGSACIFSIVRTIYVHSAGPYDASWNDATGGIWSIIELCFGLICACLPTLRPLMSAGVRERILQKTSPYHMRKNTGKNQSGASGGSSGKFVDTIGGGSNQRNIGARKSKWTAISSFNQSMFEEEDGVSLTRLEPVKTDTSKHDIAPNETQRDSRILNGLIHQTASQASRADFV